MGLLQRLNNARRALFSNSITTGMSIEELLRSMGGGAISDAGVEVSPDTVMRCGAVWSCVRVLAETEAQLPMPIYRTNKDGSREQARDHPLWEIFNGCPNQWQTAFEFREMMMGHVLLRGNAYAFVQRNLLTNDVMALIPLKPTSVKPTQKDDLTIEYAYTAPTGAMRTFTQDQVLHLRGMTLDGITGVTPITAYRNAVGLALASEKLQSKTFANGAKFNGILKTNKPMSDTAIKNLREDFGNLHSGENAFKTPLLEEGLEWQQIGMELADAQLLETRKFQKTDIAGIFRVPPHMIGDVQQAKGWSTLEQQFSEFVTCSMLPWFERWEQAARRCLLTPAERTQYTIEHNVAGLLRGDTAARYAAYNSGIMSGWLNRNEVRRMENLNPVKGLDEYLQPVNMQKPGDPPKDPNAKTAAA